MKIHARSVRRLGPAVAAIAALFLSPSFAAAQTHFYQGKSITLVQSSDAGDTSDTMVRAALPTLKKHIPGEPAIKLQFMPGGGGTKAANYIFNNAKPDGLTIANWNSALVFNQAMGDVNVKFDARKFGWVGAPSKSVPVCLIMGFAGPKTMEEIIKSGKALRMGGTGPGSHSIDMPLMLNKMLGTKFTVVSGYLGTAQIKIAMQRREVDGQCTNWDSVMATQKDLLDAKGDERMIPFLLHSKVNDPEGKNITVVNEAIKDEANIHAYRVYMAQMEYSRPLTVAPGTPKERLAVLRRAFKAALDDSDFLAQANRLKLDINHVSGEESEKWVGEVLSISPKMKEDLKYLSPVK